MPQIAEIKEIDGKIWVRVLVVGDAGALTIWSPEEIQEFKRNCVRDFLIDIYDQWKKRT